MDVLYFGVLKDLVGRERELVELADGCDVAGLLLQLRGERAASGVWASLAVAVNREYAGLATVLRDEDEVALLPPVSGGLGESLGGGSLGGGGLGGPTHRGEAAMNGARMSLGVWFAG